jgi:hypothetical protein
VTFLSPLALLLAGAAAVPLVLHLLRRRVGEPLDFPAVRYLLRAQKEHSRELKLRNMLLMVLRILAVLAIAFAAAHPVGRLIGAAHAPTALAVVLDNSLSASVVVEGAPVLARLKDAARKALDKARAGDRVWLVTADGQVVGGSTATVRAALDRTEVIGGAGDLHAAVRRAVQLTKGSGIPARQIAIVTDGQASSWTGAIAVEDVAVTIFAPTLAPPRDRAVVHATAEPAHWTPRGAVRAGTTATDSVTFRVAVGKNATARGTVAPGNDILVRLDPSERGWLAGVVEIEPDELRADDQRHFAVHVGAAPEVVADPAAGPFARTAVDALVQDGRFAHGNTIAITTADAARTSAVLFAPNDAVQVGAANRALERAGIPWKFGASRSGPAPVKGAGLTGVTATRWFALEARGPIDAGAIDTLARVTGEPWAVAGDGYVLVASPLAAEATDLPLRASWVPWLGDAIGAHLAGDAGLVIEAAPGVLVARPAWARELEAPDGTRLPVRDARVAAPSRAGVYFWLRGTARAGALVVNPEPGESDLARLPARDLAARFSGGASEVTADAGVWTSRAFDASGRRSLDGLLLAGGLLFLLAEAAATRERAVVAARP